MNSGSFRFCVSSVAWALATTLLVIPASRLVSGLAPSSLGPQAPSHQYLQVFCEKLLLADSAVPSEIRSKLNGSMRTEETDGQGRRWQATKKGLVSIGGNGLVAGQLVGKDGLPLLELTGIAAGPDGRLWLATKDGAICFQPDAPKRERWFYFWGKRYLADNDVENLVAEPQGAWIRTHTGISHIEFKPDDLERKSALFEERIRQRHNRYGFVADSQLPSAGDVGTSRPVPTDNDGLWTAIYVGAECFRYAVTHSPEALQNARASLAALMRRSPASRVFPLAP